MENDELANALKHKREILFSKNGDLLRDLDWKLTECDRRIAIRWALDGAKECEKRLFEKYPFDDTAAQAIKEAEKWARGKIKMPQAKPAILKCHARAKEPWADSEGRALFHAVGQACSAVHTQRHAIGLAVYELTAVARRYDLKTCEKQICSKISEYEKRLERLKKDRNALNGQWADFIKRPVKKKGDF